VGRGLYMPVMSASDSVQYNPVVVSLCIFLLLSDSRNFKHSLLIQLVICSNYKSNHGGLANQNQIKSYAIVSNTFQSSPITTCDSVMF